MPGNDRLHVTVGRQSLFVLVALAAFLPAIARGIEFPGPEPGQADVQLEKGGILTLKNEVLEVRWNLLPDTFGVAEIVDKLSGRSCRPAPAQAFSLLFSNGSVLQPGDFQREGEPKLESIPPNPEAVRIRDRFAGSRVRITMASRDGRVRLKWTVDLRDQANYIRQELTVAALDKPLEIDAVTLMRLEVPGARVVGTVDGSPVAADGLFLACEHPMANHRLEDGRVVGSVPRFSPIQKDRPWTLSSVLGVAPANQLRRAFLYYVERERARPYQPFTYYISWFDIAAPDRKMNQDLCLNRIHAFGNELTKRRGTKLDAFVFDDGWDDNQSLWQFHSGFPEGFIPLRTAAAEYDAILGTWISPWGGYGQAKKERLEYGKSQGFETNRHGFSLSGEKYYQRFRSVCVQQLEDFNVGYLKFDGVGPGNTAQGAGAEYGPDIEALLRLCTDLRSTRPGLFINATVGTWPSPFWLWYSDSIWRSGGDLDLSGPGNTRQQWLTYRDKIGRRIPAERGPLYPLNSLKFQSVMCAPLSLAGKLSNDPEDIIDDIRMAAASGTQVQEFFVTPDLFTPELWDAAAEAIDWVQRHADILIDTHAIGGDAAAGEVYGYASWSPRKGIVALRNPGAESAHFALDPATAFELPQSAARRYQLASPWDASGSAQKLPVEAGQPRRIDLAPFEVVVLEATPAK